MESEAVNKFTTTSVIGVNMAEEESVGEDVNKFKSTAKKVEANKVKAKKVEAKTVDNKSTVGMKEVNQGGLRRGERIMKVMRWFGE